MHKNHRICFYVYVGLALFMFMSKVFKKKNSNSSNAHTHTHMSVMLFTNNYDGNLFGYKHARPFKNDKRNNNLRVIIRQTVQKKVISP